MSPEWMHLHVPGSLFVLPTACKNLAIRDFHARLYRHRLGFVDVGRDPERTKISTLRFGSTNNIKSAGPRMG